MSRKILFGALVAMSLSSVAAEVDFSYNSGGLDPYGYGYSKPQEYDVAVALDAPDMVGKQVLGFSVPVFAADYVLQPKAWLSNELSVSKLDSKFSPDLVCYDVVVKDGMIDFTFSEPYTVPESGVFVGYSFSFSDVPESSGLKPVAVADGNKAGGLWLHAGTSQKRWADISGRYEIVSAMTVRLAGDFPSDAAGCEIVGDRIYAARGESSVLNVNVVNSGSNGVSSFDYRYTVSGIEKSGTCTLPEPLPGILGRETQVAVDIDPVAELGEFDLRFCVTGVNGKSNGAGDSVAECGLTVQPFVAVYRPLVEEYTGRGCGWCPRGYVMLEQMHLYYGDQFVGLAYHNYNNDGMSCVEKLPFNASSAPACFFNRGATLDPGQIPAAWVKAKDNNTPADVQVWLEWADDSRTMLRATARTRFIYDIPENEYLFSFALIADGLTEATWGQSNSYGDYEMSDAYDSPYWDLFIGKGSPVTGLVYNDVVVYYKEISGVQGSLPADIKAEEWYEFSYEIPVDEVKTLGGVDVVKDFDKTRMVAIVLDGKTGKPLNCASSIYPDGSEPQPLPTAVGVVSSDVATVAVRYFDLHGREVSVPVKGVYVEVMQMSDGSVVSKKIMR